MIEVRASKPLHVLQYVDCGKADMLPVEMFCFIVFLSWRSVLYMSSDCHDVEVCSAQHSAVGDNVGYESWSISLCIVYFYAPSLKKRKCVERSADRRCVFHVHPCHVYP